MKQSPVPAFVFLAALAALLAFCSSGLLVWKILGGLQQTGLAWTAWSWQAWKVWHWAAFIEAPLPLGVPALLGLASGGLVGWWASSTHEEHGADKHIRGRMLLTGAVAKRRFYAAMRRECQAGGVGLQVHPSFPPISERREKEHFFLLAGPGGGKTQLLIPWINAARQRGDRVLIHDIKGDFTAGLAAPKTNRIILIAPWDTRSEIWNVAEDVATRSAAREFAERLVPDSKSSPMFPAAARQVLTGLCVYLQSIKPGTWGFADLATLAAKDMSELLEIMKQYHPEAIRAMEAQNVTTVGILINMTSFMSPIFDLACAWPNPPAKGKGFSMRRWLTGKDSRKTLILQGSGEFAQLATGVNGALVGLAAQIVSSPSLPDSNTRRVWFILDEFPQLGRLESAAKLIELGRSKGVRCVLAAQSLDQMKAIYDTNRAAGWLAQVGTLIVGRTQGETADHVSAKLIGEREVERASESRTTGTGQSPGIFTPGGTLSASTHRVTEPVVMPADLAALGPDHQGVNLLWLLPEFALKLNFPFTNFPPRRETSVPSGWTAWPQEVRIAKFQPPPEQTNLAQQPPILGESAATSERDRDDDEPGELDSITQQQTASSNHEIESAKTVIQQPLVTAPLIVEKPASASVTKAVAEVAESELEEIAKPAITEAIVDPLDSLLPGLGSAVHLVEQISDLSPDIPSVPVEVLPQTGTQPQRRLKLKFRKLADEEELANSGLEDLT